MTTSRPPPKVLYVKDLVDRHAIGPPVEVPHLYGWPPITAVTLREVRPQDNGNIRRWIGYTSRNQLIVTRDWKVQFTDRHLFTLGYSEADAVRALVQEGHSCQWHTQYVQDLLAPRDVLEIADRQGKAFYYAVRMRQRKWWCVPTEWAGGPKIPSLAAIGMPWYRLDGTLNPEYERESR